MLTLSKNSKHWLGRGLYFHILRLIICNNSIFLLPEVNHDYSYGYREQYNERTDQPFQPDLNTSMMYYYDDGTGMQVYSVDETLLKEYIKRQM